MAIRLAAVQCRGVYREKKGHTTHCTQNCLFTRLESLVRSQQGSDRPVSAEKKVVYEVFVLMGKLGWDSSALLALTTWKVEILNPSFFQAYQHLPFPPTKQCRVQPYFPPSKQRLHKSQLLQKLSCQKPYWDQARLSSLVKKTQVDWILITALFTLYASHCTLQSAKCALHTTHCTLYQCPIPQTRPRWEQGVILNEGRSPKLNITSLLEA